MENRARSIEWNLGRLSDCVNDLRERIEELLAKFSGSTKMGMRSNILDRIITFKRYECPRMRA